jgi:tRNA threonylcarbamoyl adenosine modification protein YeaZ
MVVLGLDTTGADCSACVVRGETVLAYLSEPIGRGHAERLAPMVVEVLQDAGVTPENIDRIAVCTGPGSFTGLRVALSFAKGFALPRKTPVLGFDALSVYAQQVLTGGVKSVSKQNRRFFGLYQDVKRGQFMFAIYSNGMPEAPIRIAKADEIRAECDMLQLLTREVKTIDVRIMAKMAQSANPSDYPANPLYARAPDAKLPGGITPPAQPA